jgi:phenylalanine-4-hydroxylase
MKQQEIISKLPSHLQCFVLLQDYAAYTARDHAVWRFLMHQLQYQLAESAHPVYLEGLAKTGISLEHIPSIDEMNECLGQIGWQALCVDGFIPPAIFMEFQSLRTLVIATNMRTIDQILYTPAPDILHESAGHAPFLIDVDYAEFLQKIGEIGMKALSSKQDETTYEAIRHLSIIKEKTHVTVDEIKEAESNLNQAIQDNKELSEAALLTRLHWWTVEYGLVGDLDDYKIFGAGLLSSLGESRHCLNDEQVKKKLLTVDAINQPYDITTEQPQLFVTHSCRHLSQVLEDAANGMAQCKGGAHSVRAAIHNNVVNTLIYSSGLQVSGVITNLITDAMDNVSYIQTTGKTQLSWRGAQLTGHGTDYHTTGFGSPVGYVNEFSRSLSDYSIDELRFAGIQVGKHATLEYVSGVVVDGKLTSIERRDQKNILFSLDECKVTGPREEILFDPKWGPYDMAVGTDIISVCGGSADPSTFPLHNPPDEQTSKRNWSDSEQRLFQFYADIKNLRRNNSRDLISIDTLISEISDQYPDEWLLLFECYELIIRDEVPVHKPEKILSLLKNAASTNGDTVQLVQEGLRRIAQD